MSTSEAFGVNRGRRGVFEVVAALSLIVVAEMNVILAVDGDVGTGAVAHVFFSASGPVS